jgi:UPF0271 protein
MSDALDAHHPGARASAPGERPRGVSLNIDLGELPDEPEALYRLANVVNLACGGHAGDEPSMRRGLELAAGAGARVMAHPSYLDRAGFGRKTPQPLDAGTIERTALAIGEQCRSLAAIAGSLGVPIVGLKPHGALYHDAGRHLGLAHALIEATAALGPKACLVGPPGSPLAALAAAAGIAFSAEGFADRGYAADGSLLPRGTAGALITDPAAATAQALALARTGRYATLCVHGDNENAVAIATAVRTALTDEGLLA